MIASTDLSSSFRPASEKSTARSARTSLAREEAQYDAGLVRRFNGGDESAFVEIVTRHRERMFTVAFAMLKNHADAEEIAQDAFIRAHRGLARFRGDASLATWLHRIALNLARNRYWYFFRRCRHSSLSLESAFSPSNASTFSDLIATDAADPMRVAVANEFSDLVTSCMARLGAGQCRILTLRNAQNRSYGEIAGELGINIGTVKSRIARARERLRLLLIESCPEFSPDAQPTAWFEFTRTAGGLAVACA